MGKVVKTILKIVGIAALIVGTAGLALGASSVLLVGGGFSVLVGVGQVLAFGLLATSFGFGLLEPGIPELRAAESLAANVSIFSAPNATRQIIFGRAGVAGQIVFRDNKEIAGQDDEIVIILAIAGYPCDALEKFWLNGELVFDGDTQVGPGAITTGKFANKLWVYFRTGDEVSAAFPAIAAESAVWNVRPRVLRGICAVALRIIVDEELEGRMEPLAQVRGSELYDPRLDSTVPGGSGAHRFATPSTWEWSENPKLAELLYLRGADVDSVTIFGMGRAESAIDLVNFASEADICEEQIDVVGGGTIDRYTCNGVLRPDGDHRKNLKALLSASAGTMDASEGIYRTFAGSSRASVLPLTETDVDGPPLEMRLERDPSTEVNIIKGQFADMGDRWQVKEYPERRDAVSIGKVGELATTLDLPFTSDHRICQRISKILLLRANAQKLVLGNFWLRALQLQPGDVVTFSYTRYGFNVDTMRIIAWSVQAGEDSEGNNLLHVPMQLVTELSTWYDWDDATEEITLGSGAVGLLTGMSSRVPWNLIVDGPEKPEDGATQGGLSNIMPMGYGTFERIPIGNNNFFSPSLNVLTANVQSDQAKIGSRSLKLVMSGSVGGIGAYLSDTSTLYNMPLTPNRRWLVILWVRQDIASSVDWRVAIKTSDAVLNAAGPVNLSAADTWAQMAFDVDLTSKPQTSALLRIYANSFPINQNAWIGVTDILDVTEHPGLTASNFPTAHFQAEGPTGSLADLDDADWQNDVTGAGKPDDNADVTSVNTAAAIAGQGDLATLNTVDTDEIVEDAVSVDGFANSASVDMQHTSFTTIETFDIEVPNPVPAGASIMAECSWSYNFLGKTGLASGDTKKVSVQFRLLDDDNVVLDTISDDTMVMRRLAGDTVGFTGNNSVGVFHRRLPFANLNVGTNTLKLQVQHLEVDSQVTSISGAFITMQGIVRKK